MMGADLGIATATRGGHERMEKRAVPHLPASVKIYVYTQDDSRESYCVTRRNRHSYFHAFIYSPRNLKEIGAFVKQLDLEG